MLMLFIAEEPQLVISEADCSGDVDQEDLNKNRGNEEVSSINKLDEPTTLKDTPTSINARDSNNNIIEETESLALNDNLMAGDTPLDDQSTSSIGKEYNVHIV